MKKFLFFVAFTVLLAPAIKDPNHQMAFRDQLHSENKKKQFMTAVEIAPTTFVYEEYSTDGKTTSTFKHMAFNPSMRNTLKCDVVRQDDGLRKRLGTLHTVLWPLAITLDLTVVYTVVEESGDLRTDYLIDNIKIWGKTASTKMISDIEEANPYT